MSGIGAPHANEYAVTHGHSRGRSATPAYRSWGRMKARCFNPRNNRYADYGGRGITVCERWVESFENFLDDMGERPGLEFSIDRIDNDGNYEPGNRRWATRSEQIRNRRSPWDSPEYRAKWYAARWGVAN